ncbi:MAG: D-alanine--D-alanine ligase family protein, partial [bacterium]
VLLDDIQFPLIVKPVHEGSSIGVRRSSRVTSERELAAEVRRIHKDYNQPALVEAFVEGPEYTVGLLGNGKDSRVIGVMEIVPKRGAPEEFVYSLEVKRNWREEVDYKVNPPLSPGTRKALEEAARRVYEILRCRDVARLDFRLDACGVPNFLEVNPLPGLNPDSSDLPILAYGAGWTYDDLVGGILAHALERHGQNEIL